MSRPGSLVRFGWLCLVAVAGHLAQGFAGTPAGAQAPGGPSARLDTAALDREVQALLKGHGKGVAASLWLGGNGDAPWFERNAAEPRPTASAIKVFYLVELFAAHAGTLDEPLPGADAVLKDDGHPAISHFSPAQRNEIRKALSGASVRRVGAVMIGTPGVSNAVYNAAANLTTAVLGGPDALTKLIRKRNAAFAQVSVRRYMLRDRKTPGDNEAPAAAFGALYGRLATGQLAGVEGKTLEAVRATLFQRKDAKLGSHFAKDGGLTSDPLTSVRAGWWQTSRGPLVYVVMTAEAAPDGADAVPAFQRLAKTADAVTDALTRAGQAAMK